MPLERTQTHPAATCPPARSGGATFLQPTRLMLAEARAVVDVSIALLELWNSVSTWFIGRARRFPVTLVGFASLREEIFHAPHPCYSSVESDRPLAGSCSDAASHGHPRGKIDLWKGR